MFNKKLSLLALVLLAQSASVFAYNNATACKAAKEACKGSGYTYGAINLSTTGGGGLDRVHATCVKKDDDKVIGSNNAVTLTVKDKSYTAFAKKDSASRHSSSIGLMCKAGSTCHDGKKDWEDCLF